LEKTKITEVNMHLQPVIKKPNGNRWCGPAVVSSLMGIDTDHAARLIRQVTGKANCTRTTHSVIMETLMRAGFRLDVKLIRGSRDGITLAQWLRDSKDARGQGRVFLVAAGSHWQLIEGDQYVCGLTKDVVTLRHPRVRTRGRVTFVAEVAKMHS
jgi:hypothetical protein